MNTWDRKKALLASAVGAACIAASGTASAVVVGGVDFGIIGANPINQHLETTTLAETYINGNNQILTGYGQVNTVNGDTTYTTVAGQRLYFTFTGYLSQNFTNNPPPAINTVDFTGGTISVYLGNEFNLLNQSSAANLALIQALTPWATFTGHADVFGHTLSASGNLTGNTISFEGDGLLDITGGLPDVVSFLNANLIDDGAGGFADMVLTTSGNNRVLNPFDNTTGCRTGTAQVGQWCIAGSADIRGDTVIPEPSTIALTGLALVGLGALRRRRAA